MKRRLPDTRSSVKRKKLPPTEDEIKYKKELKLLKNEIKRRMQNFKATHKKEQSTKTKVLKLKEKIEKSQVNMKEDKIATEQFVEEQAKLEREQIELMEDRKKHKAMVEEHEKVLNEDIKKLQKKIEPRIQQKLGPKPNRSKPVAEIWEPIDLPQNLKPCDTILKKLDKLEFIFIFQEEISAEQYPDYYEIIKRPMNLKKVRKNLFSGLYANINQFAKDMRQIWANARAYNPESHKVHQWAKEYSDIFETLFRTATASSLASARKEKCPLTPAEITDLQNKLAQLSPIGMEYVVDFLRTEMPEKYAAGDELMLDLDNLPGKILLRLADLVDNEYRMKPTNRAQKRQRIMRELKHWNETEISIQPPPPPLKASSIPSRPLKRY